LITSQRDIQFSCPAYFEAGVGGLEEWSWGVRGRRGEGHFDILFVVVLEIARCYCCEELKNRYMGIERVIYIQGIEAVPAEDSLMLRSGAPVA
jgi:hypothetical protein